MGQLIMIVLAGFVAWRIFSPSEPTAEEVRFAQECAAEGGTVSRKPIFTSAAALRNGLVNSIPYCRKPD